MSRKRSAYRPKGVLTNPLCIVRPADQRILDDVMLVFYSALDLMASGGAGINEWRQLADASNLLESMVDLHMLSGEQSMPVIRLAGDELREAAQLFKAGGGMWMKPAGIEAFSWILGVYEEAAKRLTEFQMGVVHKETERRVHALQRSMQEESEVVCL